MSHWGNNLLITGVVDLYNGAAFLKGFSEGEHATNLLKALYETLLSYVQIENVGGITLTVLPRMWHS